MTPTTTTKRTLSTLSHAVEELAAAAGPDAAVIALFQRGAYFAPMASRYARIAAAGATVIVAYVGAGPVAPGVHHVALEETDPLASEWSVVLVTPTVAAHVTGLDLVDFDPTESDLESGRRFTGTWGFDRVSSADRAEELLTELTGALDGAVVTLVRTQLEAARNTPATPGEGAVIASAHVLVEHLVASQRELGATKAALSAETEIATRDPLTGLFNREGLERWLGGGDVAGIEMPAMGVIMLDLDGFKNINDELGHLAGDRLLQGVAAALLAATRPGDIVTRWGGDEFVVLCPGAVESELNRLADRLLEAIANVRVGGASVHASAGMQICATRPLRLDRADAALYAAKAAGGGRSVMARSAAR